MPAPKFFPSFAVALALTSSGVATELPPGFLEEIVAEKLASATSMSFAPDGRLWVAGRLGDVWVLDLALGGEPTHLGRIPVATEGERGISGIAIDPDFSENQHVWIYYTTADAPFRNRLSRFRQVGEQLVDETVVYESPALDSKLHNGGCIRFASDGTLFLSTGDDFQGNDTAQSLSDPRGKILHIARDGSPAPGNPFLTNPSADPRVWAYGLRNPWRFNLQPGSENLFIGDVGNEAYEEVNLGVPGGNFGWRLTEGPEPPGVEGVVYPIYSYPRTSPLGHAVIGGDHARTDHFPPEYAGHYFFADAVTNEIFRMEMNASNEPVLVERFASGTAAGPVDLQFGPDGKLYYVAFYGSTVRRIAYAGGGNRQPVASASVFPDSGPAPLAVTLDASESFDPEGGELSYFWDLGDGEKRSGLVVQKSYPAGAYSAQLTVTDSGRLSSIVRDLRIVSGNSRPEATISEPSQGLLYDEKQTISFSGSGVDPEEGSIPCEGFTWRVVFHHLGHSHPFLGPLQGTCRGSFVIESHGESSTFYQIHLSVTDSGMPLGPGASLRGERSVEIHPRGSSLR